MSWRSVIPIAVVLSLTLLAAGLSHISFVGVRYGPPPESEEESSRSVQPPQSAEGEDLSPVWEQILSVSLGVLLLVSVIVVILRPKSLWEMIKRVLPAVLWFVTILLILLHWRNRSFFVREQESAPPGAGASPTVPDQPFPTLEQVHVPSWAVFLFVLAALLVIGGAILVIWRLWQGRARPIEELAELSRRYAHDLRYGAPVHETILRCYREMCQLLSERFHLEMSRAMTAREFERRLAQIGVLEEHISRLSRLFEWARYSPAHPSPEHEHEALQLLEEIARIYGSRRESEEVPHPA